MVACGAVGAGAARGAATKAVKSAPGTIYRRGSCHPEADFFIARGQWLAPRPQPLQRSTAPVKKRERAILSPFRISRKPRLLRLGHPQKGEHHSETESLNPSAHPAHLQPRLLRSFGQRSGARQRGKTQKLSREAVEASTSALQAFRQSSPDSQAVRLREATPEECRSWCAEERSNRRNCLAAALQADAFAVIHPPCAGITVITCQEPCSSLQMLGW